MKYIAQIETTVQISPDDYKLTRPALELKSETTVQDIIAWADKVGRQYGYAKEITIRQIDHPQP